MEHQAIAATRALNAQPIFTISRAALLPALQLIAAKVIERRNTHPILATILIEASPCGAVRLTGSDLDLWVSADIIGEVERPGAVALNAKTLLDIVKKGAKDSDVCFHVSESALSDICRSYKAKITIGKALQTLAASDAADFPIPNPAPGVTLSGEFEAEQFAADIAMVTPAISKEETRYYLNGINFNIENGLLCMAATDGHRLSLVERDASGLIDTGFRSAIISRKATASMTAIIKVAGADKVALDLNASRAVFVAGNIRMVAKLIDSTFPDYRRAIPQNEKLQSTLSVQSAEILTHCAGIDGRKGTSAALQIELEGRAIIAGQVGDSGYSRPLSAEYEGQDCILAFNAAYMTQFAKLSDRLSIHLQALLTNSRGDVDAPMLIKADSAPRWTGVLMPVRADDRRLPKARAVNYAETIAAPGQAADLFGIEKTAGQSNRFGDNTETLGINPGPRKATPNEIEAYARDYAARLGHVEAAKNWTFSIAKTNAAGQVVAAEFDAGDIEEQHKSLTIILPGYGQDKQPVTVEIMDDAGEYGAPMACVNARGAITLPDAPKARAKAKARKVAAVVTPIDEPAPIAPVSDEFEPSYRELPNGNYQTSDNDGNIWLHKRDGSQELIHDETGDAMAKAVAHGKMMRDSWQSFQDEFLSPQGAIEAQQIEAHAKAIQEPKTSPSANPAQDLDRSICKTPKQQWRAAYRLARTDKTLQGGALDAALKSQFEFAKAFLFYLLITNIQQPIAAIRPMLQAAILNGGGTKNAWLAPPIGTPRFASWQRIARAQQRLASRLSARGLTKGDCNKFTLAMVTQFDAGRAALSPHNNAAPIDAQSDAIAALTQRIEALEAALQQATPPSGEIADFEPLPHDPRALSIMRGKQEIAAEASLSVQSKPKRTAAHVRAIMAYLAMRKARATERKHNAIGMVQLDAMRGERDQLRKSLETVQADSIRWQQQDAAREKAGYAKRRRAVLSARVRSQAAWQLGRSLIEGNSKLELSLAESDRLQRVTYQQAGHIVSIAERLDRAEAILRGQGPFLKSIPPISLAVAA